MTTHIVEVKAISFENRQTLESDVVVLAYGRENWEGRMVYGFDVLYPDGDYESYFCSWDCVELAAALIPAVASLRDWNAQV